MREHAVTVDPLVYHGTKVFQWIESIGPKKGYRTKVALRIKLPPWMPVPEVTVGADFCFDGASGIAIDGVGNMLAALAHDRLYDLIRLGVVKGLTYAKADRLYRAVCQTQDAGRARAWTHYVCLRMFGWAWPLLTARRNKKAADQGKVEQ